MSAAYSAVLPPSLICCRIFVVEIFSFVKFDLISSGGNLHSQFVHQSWLWNSKLKSAWGKTIFLGFLDVQELLKVETWNCLASVGGKVRRARPQEVSFWNLNKLKCPRAAGGGGRSNTHVPLLRFEYSGGWRHFEAAQAPALFWNLNKFRSGGTSLLLGDARAAGNIWNLNIEIHRGEWCRRQG